MRPLAITALACSLLLTPGCKTSAPPRTATPAPLQPAACGTVQPIHAVGDLYLAGQPSAEDFTRLKALGIKTVIDLRYDRETPELDEAGVVNGLGLTYIHLPFSGADELTDARLDEMRRLLREAERPLLLHCASANRVGAGWLAYRVLDEGAPIEQALAEAKQVGLRSAGYEAKALEYLAQRLQTRE